MLSLYPYMDKARWTWRGGAKSDQSWNSIMSQSEHVWAKRPLGVFGRWRQCWLSMNQPEHVWTRGVWRQFWPITKQYDLLEVTNGGALIVFNTHKKRDFFVHFIDCFPSQKDDHCQDSEEEDAKQEEEGTWRIQSYSRPDECDTFHGPNRTDFTNDSRMSFSPRHQIDQ